MEVTAILAVVDSSFRSDTRAPECALNVGEGGRIWACVGRGEGRIALKVDVERSAEVRGVTELLALDGVIGLEGGETQIGIGIHRGLEIREGAGVALWCGGIIGGVLTGSFSKCYERIGFGSSYRESLEAEESWDGVLRWLWAIAIWLLRARVIDTTPSEALRLRGQVISHLGGGSSLLLSCVVCYGLADGFNRWTGSDFSGIAL